MHGKILVLIVLATALIVAGCGDSEEPLTKAEFIQQGDAICKEGHGVYEGELKAVLEKSEKSSKSLEEQREAAAMTIVLPSIQTEAEELGDLEAPEADAEKADAIVEGLERTVEKGEEDPLRFWNTTGGLQLKEIGDLATDYGFKVCAQY